jgi:hypothetical protein
MGERKERIEATVPVRELYNKNHPKEVHIHICKKVFN